MRMRPGMTAAAFAAATATMVAGCSRRKLHRLPVCQEGAGGRSWPVAPHGRPDCRAPIGSDRRWTGHGASTRNAPQMTQSRSSRDLRRYVVAAR